MAGSRTKLALLLAPPLLLLVTFMLLPLLGLFRSSFFVGSGPIASGFSFEQYAKFLLDEYYLGVLAETIGIGLSSAVLSVLIGYPVGYSLARLPAEKRRRRLILVILPMTLSLVVVVFGWLVALGRNGLLNSILMGLGVIDSPGRFLFNRAAVLLVLVQQYLPFMILSVMSGVAQIDPVLEQAAANLRADRFTTFRRVILPLSIPGILSGFTLVFILSVSAFITPKLIGGSRVQMIGSLIYEQVLTVLNWPFSAAMSFVLLTLTLGLTALANTLLAVRFTADQGKKHASRRA
ncbi:MAG: ABC transporter permease [Desulfovibrio sp.]|jgi:putative spermidine/putrescine transport system permease protein|nr:ABC transporter permease [Desulfovibrio sp.]